MPLVIRCEHCQAPLRLPDEYVGQEVRCPSCQTTFVARESLESPPPRPRAEEPPREDPAPRREDERPPRRVYDDDDRPRRPRDDDDYDRPRRARDDDDYDRPSRRRGYFDDDPYRRRKEPHRGGAIQTMGILCLCLFCFTVISIVLGIVTLVMANGDLEKMRAGFMDRSGEAQTNAGKTCATIGLVLAALCVVVWMCFFFGSLADGPRRW
jgi:predicted Zn finger-like uncharacterized protein